MKIEYKLHKKFKDQADFSSFIQHCELSLCYPWNISTLKIMLNRQSRTPPRYPNREVVYECSWTYSDLDQIEVESWMTWMALKYLITFSKTVIYINEQTNQVTERTL